MLDPQTSAVRMARGETRQEHLLDKHLSRRSLLKGGLYGILSTVFWRSLVADSLTPPSPAKHCILLFMNGGPSQTDTFDPKPNNPNGGPFQSIKTSAPDIL